ncbi:hypothetical protein ScPMuIL_004097 [Solemya velum]
MSTRLTVAEHSNPRITTDHRCYSDMKSKTYVLAKRSTVLCSVLVKGVQKTCICVLFDPTNLIQSCVLTDPWSLVLPDTPDPPLTNVSFVIWKLLTLEDVEQIDITRYDNKEKQTRDLAFGSAKVLSWVFHFMVIFRVLLDNRWVKLEKLKFLVETPAVTWQLKRRALQIHRVQSLDQCSPVRKLEVCDVYYRQLLDTALGICVMSFFMVGEKTEFISSFTIAWGEFFLYHVYLWTGYLSLLQPALGRLLWYSSMFGVRAGLSVQLCLIQDILSTLTLHIYCFYVYAARLYRLQISSLASLWRLFRGKKWNAQLRRVDSAIYNVDQLFFGTLLFTILLFLLPTTTLYYFVFTLLRICMLVVQWVVSKFVSFLNVIPVYTAFLWSIKSPKVAGDFMFSVVSADNDTVIGSNMVLRMRTTQVSLEKLLSLTILTSFEFDKTVPVQKKRKIARAKSLSIPCFCDACLKFNSSFLTFSLCYTRNVTVFATLP